MIDKNDRVAVAKETIEISKSGKYTVGITTVELEMPVSKMVDLNNLAIDDGGKFKGEIVVEGLDSVSAILKYGKETAKLGVLNFASARNPGGGFDHGAMAQEEALCYCSNLYLTQLEMKETYYDKNMKTDGCYTHNMFFSHYVSFFRDAKFDLLSVPTMCKVLTVPAVNRNSVSREKSAFADAIMRDRVDNIVKAFAQEGCDTIILGAFGCGVFGNKPEFVANLFKESLKVYRKHFNKVVFAVLSGRDSNLEVFKQVFNG